MTLLSDVSSPIPVRPIRHPRRPWIRRLAQVCAFIAIGFAAWGIAGLSREFAKLRIGPFYLLEVVFCIWLVFAIFADFRFPIRKTICALWPVVVFSGWGSCLLVRDLLIAHTQPLPFDRLLQHSVLFVYPILWMGVGYWMQTESPIYTRRIVLGILIINALPNFFGILNRNLSLGPLLAVFWIYQCNRLDIRTASLVRKMGSISLLILLGVVTFLPFWKMWLDTAQRTSILLLFLTCLGAPFLLRDRADSYTKPVVLSLTSILIFLAGCAAAPFIRWPGTSVSQLYILSPHSASSLPIYTKVHKPNGDFPNRAIAILVSPSGRTSPSSRTEDPSMTSLEIVQHQYQVPGDESRTEKLVEIKDPPAALFPLNAHHNTGESTVIVRLEGSLKTLPQVMDIHRVQPGLSTLQASAILKDRFLDSMQHGEDRPGPADTKTFQLRTRRYLWERAILDWIQKPIVGIGFWPEVPSYVAPNRPNVAWNGPPITGPHDSYLSILVRTGIIGSIFFIILVVAGIKHIIRIEQKGPPPLTLLLVFFIILNGATYAIFNVGFESPHNCMLFWMAYGILFAA